MCQCTPEIKTPWCGKPGCEKPEQVPDPYRAPSMVPSEQEPILKFFTYAHLQPRLQDVSRPYALLAIDVIMQLPRSAERTVALRKLLESKDAAVRAALP